MREIGEPRHKEPEVVLEVPSETAQQLQALVQSESSQASAFVRSVQKDAEAQTSALLKARVLQWDVGGRAVCAWLFAVLREWLVVRGANFVS